jgi:hypothetical protein
MRLWDDLRSTHPVKARQWHDRLALLSEARNGLAHADDQKIAKVVAAGWPLTLRSARKWRSTLEALAVGMDRAVRRHLSRGLRVEAW